MQEFEEWWESETPRFGEVNAKGWAAGIVESDESVSANSRREAKARVDEPMSASVALDAYDSWYKNEKTAEKLEWQPLCASRSGK